MSMLHSNNLYKYIEIKINDIVFFHAHNGNSDRYAQSFTMFVVCSSYSFPLVTKSRYCVCRRRPRARVERGRGPAAGQAAQQAPGAHAAAVARAVRRHVRARAGHGPAAARARLHTRQLSRLPVTTLRLSSIRPRPTEIVTSSYRVQVNGKPTNISGRGGRRHVISWMDAPDDLYFRATEIAK